MKVRNIRRVEADEVISEYLKSEFDRTEYDGDRAAYSDIVHFPSLDSEQENAVRRDLLFRRRQTIWGHLPADTQWWQVELQALDVLRLQLFSRGHWRKISPEDRSAVRFAKRLSEGEFSPKWDRYLKKIEMLRASLLKTARPSSVILIGTDAHSPFTILEGNHRCIAALTISEDVLRTHLRYYCGLSPRMSYCVWHHNFVWNMARYGLQRVVGDTSFRSASDPEKKEHTS